MTKAVIAEEPSGKEEIMWALRKAYGSDAVSMDDKGRIRLLVEGEPFVLIEDEAYQAMRRITDGYIDLLLESGRKA